MMMGFGYDDGMPEGWDILCWFVYQGHGYQRCFYI